MVRRKLYQDAKTIARHKRWRILFGVLGATLVIGSGIYIGVPLTVELVRCVYPLCIWELVDYKVNLQAIPEAPYAIIAWGIVCLFVFIFWMLLAEKQTRMRVAAYILVSLYLLAALAYTVQRANGVSENELWPSWLFIVPFVPLLLYVIAYIWSAIVELPFIQRRLAKTRAKKAP